jgi:hypothetical protein
MSTALLHHHQRSHMIAAGAAVLVIASVGVVLAASQDDPASTNAPSDTTSVTHFRLTGGTHEEGNWNHAGTTSGGQIQPAP